MTENGASTPARSTNWKSGFFQSTSARTFHTTYYLLLTIYSVHPRTRMSEENGDHDEYDKIVRDTQAEFSDARAKRKAGLFVAVTAACALGATAKNEVLPGQRRNPLRTHSVTDSVTSGGSGTAFSQTEVPLCTVSCLFRAIRSLITLEHL